MPSRLEVGGYARLSRQLAQVCFRARPVRGRNRLSRVDRGQRQRSGGQLARRHGGRHRHRRRDLDRHRRRDLDGPRRRRRHRRSGRSDLGGLHGQQRRAERGPDAGPAADARSVQQHRARSARRDRHARRRAGARREDRSVLQQRDRARRRHAGAAASGDRGVAGHRRQGAHGPDLALRSRDRHRHQHHLRDALRDRVRQARLPPPARNRRGPGLRRALHAGQAGRRRGERVPPGRRGDAAVAVLPVPPRRRRDRHAAGGDHRAHALRAGVAAVVLPLEHDARRHAVRARRRRDARHRFRPDRRGAAHARQRQGGGRRSRSSTASGSTSPSCPTRRRIPRSIPATTPRSATR